MFILCWLFFLAVFVFVAVSIITNHNAGKTMFKQARNCTDGDTPTCLPRTCYNDSNCQDAGGVTCCYCDLNTRTCQNTSTCSSCVASCLQGDSPQNCCCSICPGQSGVQDCGRAPMCADVTC